MAVIGLHATFEHHDAFSAAVLKAFIQEYRLKFPIALDQPNPASPIPHTMERYKMRGTPSLVLIDRHGLVRKHAFGAVDDLRIGAEIGALTQEPGGAALAEVRRPRNQSARAKRMRIRARCATGAAPPQHRLIAPLRESADRGFLEHSRGAGGMDGNVLHRAAFGDGEIQFDPTFGLVRRRPSSDRPASRT